MSDDEKNVIGRPLNARPNSRQTVWPYRNIDALETSG